MVQEQKTTTCNKINFRNISCYYTLHGTLTNVPSQRI